MRVQSEIKKAIFIIFLLSWGVTLQAQDDFDDFDDLEAELELVEEDADNFAEEMEFEEGDDFEALEEIPEEDGGAEEVEELGFAEEDEEVFEDLEEFPEDELLEFEEAEEVAPAEESLELEPLELVEDLEDEPMNEPSESAPPVGEPAPVVSSDPSVNEPNLDYEARLYEIYLNYHSNKMPEEEWKQIAGDRQTEIYSIQEGDTLWGISSTLFGDGNYWPKVWSLNGRITNPHLINPGNQIRFLLGDEADAPAFTVAEPEVATPEEEGASEEVQLTQAGGSDVTQSTEEEFEIPPPTSYSRPVVLKLPPSLPTWQLNSVDSDQPEYDDHGIDYGRRPILDVQETVPLTSYIAETPPDALGEVSEIELGNRIANAFQYVFVHMKPGEAQIGDKFLVVSHEGQLEPVNDYVEGPFGHAVKVQGEIQLTEKMAGQPKDQYTETYRALVTEIVNPVSVGSSIVQGKIKEISVTDEGPRSSVQAQIIGGGQFARRQVYGLQSMAYLNRGRDHGLREGQVLPVRAMRKLRNQDSLIRENARPVGWIKIVKTTPRFATAIIVNAWSEILSGDLTGYGSLGSESAFLEDSESSSEPADSDEDLEEDFDEDFGFEEE